MENTNNIQSVQQQWQQIQNNCVEKYDWWLISNSLIKRSLAVFWHYVLGYLIVMVIFLLILSVLAIVVWWVRALMWH